MRRVDTFIARRPLLDRAKYCEFLGTAVTPRRGTLGSFRATIRQSDLDAIVVAHLDGMQPVAMSTQRAGYLNCAECGLRA
jgi:hypothetical protein